MGRTLFLAIALIMWCVGPERALAQANCGTAAECNAIAKTATQRGDLKTALDAYRLQTDFATGERVAGGGDVLVCDGFKSLARLSLQLRKPLQGHAWAQVAEANCTPDPDLQAIVATHAFKLQNVPTMNSIAGLYWDYAGYGQWNELTVTDRGNGHFGVQWDMKRYGLVRSAETDGPASSWAFEGTGELKGGKLIIKYPGIGSIDSAGNEYGEGKPCELDFAVQPFALVVETDLPPECTNGQWGPYPRGTFWRVEVE
jgi:hypothetical protein